MRQLKDKIALVLVEIESYNAFQVLLKERIEGLLELPRFLVSLNLLPSEADNTGANLSQKLDYSVIDLIPG